MERFNGGFLHSYSQAKGDELISTINKNINIGF